MALPLVPFEYGNDGIESILLCVWYHNAHEYSSKVSKFMWSLGGGVFHSDLNLLVYHHYVRQYPVGKVVEIYDIALPQALDSVLI